MSARAAIDRARPSRSPEETERLAESFAPSLREGDVLLLTGPLGSGKTCFVHGLARGLGVTGRVRSPSFTLVNEHAGRRRLYHLDLYRLTSAEAEALGLEEALEQGVLVVEWGERLPPHLAADALRLEFEIVSPTERRIAPAGAGPRGTALLEAWREVAWPS